MGSKGAMTGTTADAIGGSARNFQGAIIGPAIE